MKKFFITLFALVSIGVLTVIAVNLKDEALNPKIPPLLAWDVTPIPVENNSYLFLFGFMAPLEQDPLEFAALRIKAYEKHSEDPGLESSAFVDLTGLLCDGFDDDCYATYADKRQPLEQLIQENQPWLERYQQLFPYAEYQELLKPTPAKFIIPPSVLQTQRLLLAQIALDPLGKSGLLQQDITFWRMVLGQRTDLITKMVATRANQSAYGLLQHILAEHPELRGNFQKELLPLAKAEKSLKYSLFMEFSSMVRVLLSLENQKDTEGYNPILGLPFPTFGLEMFFYQRNSTVNQLYKYHLDYTDAIEQGSEKRNAIYRQAIDNLTRTWTVLYNPFGKYILSIVMSDYEIFLQRVATLDQQIKKIAVPGEK